jgi:endonuclease YncB( thermonuclease family)
MRGNQPHSFKIIAALVLCLVGDAIAETGKVVGVHDGDSITVLASGNEQIKVRLEGIDAPELKQPFSQSAKEALSSLVFGKAVNFERLKKDRYGRTIAVIFVGQTKVNLELVKQGFAWRYDAYSQDPVLLDAQNSAKAAKRGLRADPSPVPPWEWRASKKKKK